jgi:hypothetical protein
VTLTKKAIKQVMLIELLHTCQYNEQKLLLRTFDFFGKPSLNFLPFNVFTEYFMSVTGSASTHVEINVLNK